MSKASSVWRYGKKENWDYIKAWLERDGYTVEILEYDDSLSANNAAVILSRKVDEMLDKYQVKQIDIIAHSFGGLVSRAYIENMVADKKVDKLIMIATPNHGSHLADYLTGEMDNQPDKYKNIVKKIFEFYAGFRTDRKWGSSLDLRSKNNRFLDDLNIRFRPDKLRTKYFVIAGTGHYPQKLTSHRMFLPGPDDGVVAINSAKLEGVPLCCVELDHSSIVNPSRVKENLDKKGQLNERGQLALNSLKYMYNYIISSILKGSPPPSNDSCSERKDTDDSQLLPNIAESFNIRLNPGDKARDIFDVSYGTERIEVSFTYEFSNFNFTLTSPSGRKITPEIAEEDQEIDYNAYDHYWSYIVRNPEQGNWTWEIEAIEVPENGEDITVSIFGDMILELTATGTIPPTSFAGAAGSGKTDDSPDVTQTLFTPTAGNIGLTVDLKAGKQEVEIFFWVEIPTKGKLFLFFDPRGRLDANTKETSLGKEIISTDIADIPIFGPPSLFFPQGGIFGSLIPVSVLPSGPYKIGLEFRNIATGAVVSTSTIKFTVK